MIFHGQTPFYDYKQGSINNLPIYKNCINDKGPFKKTFVVGRGKDERIMDCSLSMGLRVGVDFA